MSEQVNDTTEPIQEAAPNEIDSLPEKDRELTKQILEEIEKEKAPKEAAPEADTSQKPKEADVKPADDGKKAADQAPKEENKRREKVVPTWMLRMAETRQQKKDEQIAQLAKELEDLKKGAATSKATVDRTPEANPEESDLENEAKEYAEQEGISLRLAKDILMTKQIATKAVTTSNGVETFTQAVKEQQERDAIEREEQLFNQDFNKEIIPLIQKEYGPDVPQSVIDEIRDGVKAKAYTEEFVKVPYSMIYKGDDKFRSLVPSPKKPVEGPRNVPISEKKVDGQGSAKDLTRELSEEELSTLSGEEFDTYAKNMERKRGSIR